MGLKQGFGANRGQNIVYLGSKKSVKPDFVLGKACIGRADK